MKSFLALLNLEFGKKKVSQLHWGFLSYKNLKCALQSILEWLAVIAALELALIEYWTKKILANNIKNFDSYKASKWLNLFILLDFKDSFHVG